MSGTVLFTVNTNTDKIQFLFSRNYALEKVKFCSVTYIVSYEGVQLQDWEHSYSELAFEPLLD